MRTFRLISLSILFAVVFSVTGFAQVPIKMPTKVGLVNIFTLSAKGGVTRYVNALGVLDKEFGTELKGLQTMVTNIQTKTKSFNALRTQASKPNSPIKPGSLRTKAAELDQLKRELKFKQDDLQARVNARRQVLIGPIWRDMMKAMKKYAEQNGFAVILDGAKLEESAIMLAFNNKSDITKDFIKYYNALPAGGAGTAK